MTDHDCPCEFPETPSLHCAYEIAMAFRDGSLMSRKAEMAQHAACLQGSIAKMFENPVFGSDSPTMFETAADAAEYIVGQVDACKREDSEEQKAATANLPTDVIVAAVIAILREVLSELLNFWN